MGRHHKMGNRREPVENRRENRGEHSAEIKRVVILIVVPRLAYCTHPWPNLCLACLQCEQEDGGWCGGLHGARVGC